MANNRMYIKCTKCNMDNTFLLCKYYPNTNWYFWSMPNVDAREERMNIFLDEHRHTELEEYDFNDGLNNFEIIYEHGEPNEDG